MHGSVDAVFLLLKIEKALNHTNKRKCPNFKHKDSHQEMESRDIKDTEIPEFNSKV